MAFAQGKKNVTGKRRKRAFVQELAVRLPNIKLPKRR